MVSAEGVCIMNQRYQQTEEKIFNSIIAFLDEHEKEELTIKKICSMANISRTTFYSHFMTVDEACLALKKRYIKNEFIENNELLTKESRHLFLQYLKQNAEFFHIHPKLAEKREMNLLYEKVKDKIKNFPGFSLDNTKLLFLTSGYIAFIFHYMSDNFSIPINEMELNLNYFVSLFS